MADFDLETARGGFPLPAGVPDAVVNKTQVADALGVSTLTIDRWVAEGMPVSETGSNGRSYKFILSDCYAWSAWRDDARRSDDERASLAARQLRLALVGGADGDGVAGRGLSAKERADAYQVEIRYTELARLRGDLVPAGEVSDTIAELVALVRAEIETMPDTVAREVGLDGRQTLALVAVGDRILTGLARMTGALAGRLEMRRTASTIREAAE